MKKFLQNITHFSIYLILINTLCFVTIKVLYYDDYSAFNPNFDTYLISDSHGHSLDTIPMQYGIYNFSDPSDSYEDMLRKVKYTLAHSEVKKIILSVDDHTLTTYRENNNNLDRSTIYANSEDFKSNYDRFLQRYVRRYAPLLHGKSRDALLMHIKRLWTATAKDGSLWADKSEAYRKAKAKERAAVHYENSERSQIMDDFLQEIIAVCKAGKVKLQGVKFPLSAPYREATFGKGFHADRVFEEHNLKVMDFSELFSEQPKYFRDQDHLSELGGWQFMPLLKEASEAP